MGEQRPRIGAWEIVNLLQGHAQALLDARVNGGGIHRAEDPARR
jgi:hypothetical protein